MIEKELKNYLMERFPTENEECEWKDFSNLRHYVRGKEGEDIISYISAISNMEGGFLIIGIEDKTFNVVGIKDFASFTKENIKKSFLDSCTNLNTEGMNITELITDDTKKIVWIISIPKHKNRLPIYAHKKAWQRVGDSLLQMRPERLDSILTETLSQDDWSAEIIPDATIDDLDETAIAKARIEYKERNPKYQDEVDNWDNIKFLDKAKITTQGKITRTAMILLGKEESEHFLGSCVKILWDLRALDNQSKDYKIFSIPFLLTIDEVYAKIRNLIYRYMPDGTLYPDEILRYDPFNIREPLNNAIAHQDYTKKARINVIEFDDDHLVFSNLGSFLPKSVEFVVLSDTPQEYYRNPFLVEAMKTLNMIETQGGGIKKMYNFQKKRYFPMPDYDFADGRVKVTITGKIINEDFSRILSRNPNMGLEEIIILDKVQKRKSLSDEEIIQLRKLKFIEGRKPNIYLSKIVIDPLNDDGLKAEYIHNKGFDDSHFKDMILEYLRKFGSAKRSAIDTLIIPKLSAVLSEEQKKRKVGNLLLTLRIENKIKTTMSREWILVEF